MTGTLEHLQSVLGDRYQLERELGRGGMATVHLARDLLLDRQVAIKVLHADLGMALGPERFRREIDIAARLDHPNILRIEDFGGSGDALFYVMPFVAGETLAARLQRDAMQPVETAVRITCQVARALDYAHRQGIVHRDVKPENILLDGDQAMLADFGIARAFSESGAERRLTQTGIALGTPVYMSPEQAVAERALDGRSDIYSLGCVLYEMLAGQPPFIGPTAQAIIARQMLDDVPSITVVRGAVPDEVEDAVLRALSKQAADRYATALEFAEALEHSLETGGRSIGSADRRSRSRRRTTGAQQAARRRGRLWLAAGVAVAVLGGGVSAWKLSGARNAAAATARAEGDVPAARRIAVLYFEDLSPDHSLAALGDGLTEELIGSLAAVQGLDVVSRNGVSRFRDPNVAADSVAQVLGAGSIVRGSVEPRGDQLRVTVRLVDGPSGADYKRASFDVPAARALVARDSVVDQVSRFLRARIGEEVRVREARRATTSDAAWALALQAEKLSKTARASAESNDTVAASGARTRADSLLARAALLDTAWADPVVQRGRLALARLALRRDAVGAQQWADSAAQLADAALRRDPRHAGALALRGTVRLERWSRHLEPDPRAAAQLLAGAEADLKQATQLAPRDAAVWSALARVYYQKPDLVEASLAARRAYETDAYLDNADRILWSLYTTAYDNESFLDAARWCDEGRQRFPKNPAFVRCQLWLFTTNARAPDATKAWTLVGELKAVTPEREWAYLGREASMLAALAAGKAGLKDSAVRVLERARAGPDIDPDRELLGTEALMRELLGQRDEALAMLKQYLVAKPEHRSLYAKSQSWWWRQMKTDPRFRELVGIGT